VYDVELDTDHLKLPANQGGDEYKADDFKCDGKDVEIKVVAWNNYTDTGNGSTYITDLTDVKITNDGMVFAIVVAPKDTPIVMPPWAKELPELGAADGSNVPTTTIEGGTVPVDTSTGDTTVDTSTGDTSTDGTTTDGTTVDTSEPASTPTDVTPTTGG
jgi:hypothetical protein